jgi:predicted phosphodiesterase
MKLMFASDIHGSLPAAERVLELFAQSGAVAGYSRRCA